MKAKRKIVLDTVSTYSAIVATVILITVLGVSHLDHPIAINAATFVVFFALLSIVSRVLALLEER